MSDKFKTSINPLDIKDELQKVIHFSRIILQNFKNMLKFIKYFIKNFVFNTFKYAYIVVIIGFSLLGLTLLLSKNKLGNLLILCYIFNIIIIAGLLSGVLAIIIICIEKTIELYNHSTKLFKKQKKIAIKCIVEIIIIILTILLLLLELFFVVCFLVIMALIIDFLMGIGIKIFNLINSLYTKMSLTSQTATTAIDSFGDMIRKGFENC